MKEVIRTPALLIGPDKTIELLLTDCAITTTNSLGLKNGLLLGNKIIDNDGNVFKTIDAVKVRNINPIWIFEFFNPMIEVELKVKMNSKKISIEKLKMEFEKSFKLHRDLWQSNFSFEEISEKVKSSKTINELIIGIAPLLS